MSVEISADLSTRPFVILSRNATRQDKAVLLTDAGRSADLLQYTLMAKIAATGKWVPFTSVAGVDGSAIPQGIYMGDDIASADIVAGDVVDLPIMETGIDFDEDMLVIENSLTLETVVTVGTTDLRQVQDILIDRGLIPVSTISISRVENA